MNRNIANGKRVLFIATVDRHIEAFHLPLIKLLAEQGYKVDVASNGNSEFPFVQQKFNVPFTRNPLTLSNVKSYNIIKKIMETYNYDIVHCHTPVGATVGRLAAKRSNAKILYTAHGFHFYKGAPIKNWILFYPIEKYLSKYTDVLLTINKEDYNIAEKSFYMNKIYLINGPGVNIKELKKAKEVSRKSLGLSENDFILIFGAELNKNKNQYLLIDAMKILVKKYKNIKLLLVGADNYSSKYQQYVKKNGLEENVIFLGMRNDISSILKECDVAVSSSIREGLGLFLIEAAINGLPLIATDNRGSREIIIDGKNGYLTSFNAIDFSNKIEYVYCNPSIFEKHQNENQKGYIRFSGENINRKILNIYQEESDRL